MDELEGLREIIKKLNEEKALLLRTIEEMRSTSTSSACMPEPYSRTPDAYAVLPQEEDQA